MAQRVSISQKELQHLYWKEQLTTFEIADLFGCSAATVGNYMREYGIKRRISGPKRVKFEEGIIRNLYEGRGLSAEKIARMFHCEQTAVLNALRRYGILIRHPKNPLVIPRGELEQYYIIEKLSTYKIAKKYHCDAKTIYRYLKLYNITTRPRKIVLLDGDKLIDLYVLKGYSLSKIAQIYNCQPSAILKKMKQFGIDRRTISETSTKHEKNDFDGNREDKAYMIGFRVGDLNVYKTGLLLHIGCGTTKNAQLDLIKKLFCDYGPGWIAKEDKGDRYHINFSLNQSFNFLLPKHGKIPRWIMTRKKFFLQFLAGYADAEANIAVSSGRARLRIRSYDYGILQDIHLALHKIGIKSIFVLEHKAYVDRRGVKHNGDCWGVSVNKKEDLYQLFTLLRPLLRHKKRQNDLETALQNVTSRVG